MSLPKIKSKRFTFKTLGALTVKQLTVKQVLDIQKATEGKDEIEMMFYTVSLVTPFSIAEIEAMPASALEEFTKIVEFCTK